MSWMEKLYQTYTAAKLLDLPQEKQVMPTSHTIQNAHINIVIDGGGNFLRATVFNKKQIFLPSTEKSASRCSGEAPHPLADKIQYAAGDYQSYGGKKKPYFEGYKNQLKAWCESENSHHKVVAVYNYINKGTVIKDLIDHSILFVDSNNILLEQWVDDSEAPEIFKSLPKKNKLTEQGDALVCWSVEIIGDEKIKTWEDDSIHDSWVAFDSEDVGKTGFCYVTGENIPLAKNHPAKLRHSGDRAKLISANDDNGFTYRGRFLDKTQACGVGFNVSQKAHNALRWLIQNQAFRNADQAYVAWTVSGKEIPDPLKDTWSLLDDFDAVEGENEEIDHRYDLGAGFSKKLKKYMAGYSAKLDHNDQIIIMGIDSATPGRMSVIYYREMFNDDFLNRLESWHTDFSWIQRNVREIKNTNGKKSLFETVWPVSSPAPFAIVKAAYGEQVKDSLKKNAIERVIPCIIDGQQFPIDLVNSCVRNAINRSGYTSSTQWLWEKNLGIACALYKGYHNRHPNLTQRKGYTMNLDENCQSRDYLYGRLLAIAERIETVALKSGNENRPTTAARLMQRFADRPFETWRTIELALQPYMQRLKSSRAGFLTSRIKEMDFIIDSFKSGDFTSKSALTGEFLLGYHSQRQKFKDDSAARKRDNELKNNTTTTTIEG